MLGRIKFELSELVNEMLDQLPESVFKSKTTTFLDPCMGGGQFVKEVEARLRRYGHSDANISQRVYGVESNKLRVNYVVNKYGLVGQYYVRENYLEYDEKMKFDVVIGNPPYNEDSGDAREQAGNSNNSVLYEAFIKKCLHLSQNHMYVTPAGWTEKAFAAVLKEHGLKTIRFMKNGKDGPFPSVNVRSGFSVFSMIEGYRGPISVTTVDNETYTQARNERIKNLSLTSKNLNEKILMKAEQTLKDIIRKGDVKVPKGMKGNLEKIEDLSKDFKLQPENNFPYAVVVYNGSTKEKVAYTDRSYDSSYVPFKVTIPTAGQVGYLGLTRIITYKASVAGTLYYVPARTKKEAEIIDNYLNSKLVRYIVLQEKQNDKVNTLKNTYRFIPLVDFSRTWTNEELYEHFGLTQEEIAYIEETVK